ncbi:transposase [Flexivirga caeni]|uniref:IS110 family transposase n=1 Tax=Flexivirga caeni TaxID=2294115 RepID=A0A3M9MEA7_9MICO|nr:transposase [Flexivirga caeni]RNI23896.1 IS110 family transposase [Flexivirga caeni]
MKVEAPQLLELPGYGPMPAARIVAETRDPVRFKSTAAFAMLAGCALIPASSGNSQRVRLNRGGNRRMNAAIHRIVITQKRLYPPAQDYLATRGALGNSERRGHSRVEETYRQARVHSAPFGGNRHSRPASRRWCGRYVTPSESVKH